MQYVLTEEKTIIIVISSNWDMIAVYQATNLCHFKQKFKVVQ